MEKILKAQMSSIRDVIMEGLSSISIETIHLDDHDDIICKSAAL